MNQATIIMIHAGVAEMPPYLKESLDIIQKIAIKSKIVFIANEENRKLFTNFMASSGDARTSRIEFVSIESIPKSMLSKEYENISTLDRNFRSGFWFNTSKRFFVLADYIEYKNIKNIIHIENDYVLYFDPTEKLDELIAFSDFSVPIDRIRAIPGIVWIKNGNVARRLADHILKNPSYDDMATLGTFCLESRDIHAVPFPTIPQQFAEDYQLDQARYSEGINLFGGIFDAAAIGQYIGGIHWIHNPSDTTFFENESSDLFLKEFSFSWNINHGIRSASIGYKNQYTNILGIHVHSKRIGGMSPYNHGAPESESLVVTGERLQALCDLTIGAKSITEFHGIGNIKTNKLVEIGESQGTLTPPTEALIEQVLASRSIFLYTHLVPYFSYYLAPKIESEFVLVTHNSDHSVTIEDYQLLNHPYLKVWMAQNCEFSHPKLRPLPIGMQNIQWGANKISSLIEVSQSIKKHKLLYVNFSEKTHPSRRLALSALNKVRGATIEFEVNYETYLNNMAQHKFCLCPRGNGIDTHRFWEAQYLGCIPIIVRTEWTAAYADMPILILENWEELSQLDLEKTYIAISSKKYLRGNLNLEFFKDQIGE